jgi:uncharacterized membrane protein YgcG
LNSFGFEILNQEASIQTYFRLSSVGFSPSIVLNLFSFKFNLFKEELMNINIRRFVVTIPILLLPLAFYSCGGDSGDSSSTSTGVPPEQEEDTGGTGGTGGSNGGSGGGGGGSSCLSTNERNDIISLMNKLVAENSIDGTAVEKTRNPDGTTTTLDYTGGYTVTKASDTSWVVSGGFCTEDLTCTEIESTFAFNNGCFFVGDQQAEINSTTTRKADYTLNSTVDGARRRDRTVVSISNGIVSENQTVTQNNEQVYSFRFKEDASGGTTGGTDGGTTGGTDGGDDGGEDGEVDSGEFF